jgi:hypothetical protein
MRTIKFRGKASHNGEWLYGDLINIHGDYHILGEDDMREDGHHITQDSDRPTWVKPNTVGQFTSLYDKNSKEIYEGDILKAGDMGLLEVRFVRGVFAFLWYGNLDDEFITGSPTHEWAEVIGNIHDNPELIKNIFQSWE